jgi:hypothetical protein
MAKTVNHAERKHALLSPSSSERWINCTPSVRLEERSGIPDTSGDAAKEGTVAHEYAETLLRLELGQITEAKAKANFKELEKSKYYADEMHGYALEYVDRVLARVDEDPEALVIVEAVVDYTEYVKEGKGSTDSTTLSGSTLYVDDFKYGKGIPVSAVENSQLMLYAIGAYIGAGRPKAVKKVVLSIHQPRIENFSTWEISLPRLLKWAEETLRPKAALAWEGKGDLNPGAWCKWCKVAPKCRAQAKQSLEVARHEFKDPALLSDSEVLQVYALVKPLEAWIKAVKSYVLDKALKGKVWEGYKLVHSRSNRVITDEAAVIYALKSEGYAKDEFIKESLAGVTELEKLLGKTKFNKLLSKFIVKPQGAPTLTNIEDGRPGLGMEEAINDFKNL